MTVAGIENLEGQAETLQLINDELTSRLARQTDAGKSIDTKAGIVAGFAAAAAQFLAAKHAHPVLAGFAYAAYAVAFCFGVWTFAVIRYDDVPKPRPLFNRYVQRSRADTLAFLAGTRIQVIENNARKYEAKARRWWVSLLFLAAGLILSVLAIVQTDRHDAGTGQPGSSAGGVRPTSAASGVHP